MSSRQLEIDVLRALYRLSRRRAPEPTLELLAARVDSDHASVRRALFGLAQNGLIQRTPAGLRLSLEGLAVAVSAAPVARRRGREVIRATRPRMEPDRLTLSSNHRAA